MTDAQVGDAGRNTGTSPASEEAMPDAKPKPDPREAKIAEIVRNALRNSPVSRTDGAWNHLEAQLPYIIAAILKEV